MSKQDTHFFNVFSLVIALLVAIAIVPADLFPQEEALVRQMVDSLHIAEQ